MSPPQPSQPAQGRPPGTAASETPGAQVSGATVGSDASGSATKGPLTLRELDAISVDRLNGVGPHRRKSLAGVGVESVFDLLTYYPRRYVDRTAQAPISEAAIGSEITVVADVHSVSSRRLRGGRRLVSVDVADASGVLSAVFFNQAWRERQLTEGRTVALFGKVENYRGRKQMTNPVVDVLGDGSTADRTGKIVAIYAQSETAGIVTWDVANWVAEAQRRCSARGIADPVPDWLLGQLELVGRAQALVDIHEPPSMADRSAARDRLVFDELLRVQLVLRNQRLAREAHELGIAHEGVGNLVEELHRRLPYTLTGAQQRVTADIDADVSTQRPMHRLLQGDVGSGKTLVALHALLVAVQNGHQGALMAPTEVLAEQHYFALRDLLAGLDIPDEARLGGKRPLRLCLLSGSSSATQRREALVQVAAGAADIVVGTHALLEESVSFKSLSVVVVDEQHRFGVSQRARLRESGRDDRRIPHLLVMTATPIPRTAAMTVYGDLDVSVLDELPPGRTPIETQWVRGPLETDVMWSRVRGEIESGRQAYVVCPLITESESLDARSAEQMHGELEAGPLAGLRVGLLHGRLPSVEKDSTMGRFRDGKLDALVATTVIEVGIDIPNATVMVVLSADRFGIAQLHQLRGRVGRGSHASSCYLVSDDDPTPTAVQRLTALSESSDGFKLAEVDLELRGEGTLFDERQSGRSDLKLASLARDLKWVQAARDAATELIAADGDLDAHPALADEIDWFASRRDPDYLQRS
ncbi:ATP-dependent DNA helicase RecG [Candidatus Poriferisodalis sp.]|uniref:ATP-dependent DNA helicase RecG n=1 Tax=Candidatus Poriferisodalis sp. TaxID=3101277 RepID=UPI003B01C2BD